MKRYWLFGFNHYYPEGGWKDFAGDYDTIGEAIYASEPHFDEAKRYTDDDCWDECHVIDSQTGKYVHGERDEYGDIITDEQRESIKED